MNMSDRLKASEEKVHYKVKNYALRSVDEKELSRSGDKFLEIVEEFGAPVMCYPSWHPLVTHHDDKSPIATPSSRCKYYGLDHTFHFKHAFVSCPYGEENAERIIESVENLPSTSICEIKAKRLDVQFYSPSAFPVIVYCEWDENKYSPADYLNQMIPASIAVPLMLMKEIPPWVWSEFGYSWEKLENYFLGEPYESAMSSFVSKETGIIMRKIWKLIISTEMFETR